MTDALAPYDAVLLVSYGGPNGPDDVLPFMRNATAGRGVPDERLVEVSGHYALFGGRSPINARNAELAAALKDALAARGSSVPVVVGNRNWHPFLSEALGSLAEAGAKRVVCVITSAYASYSGCRQYREDLAAALEASGAAIELDKIGPYADTQGFLDANVDALVDAVVSTGSTNPAAGRAASASVVSTSSTSETTGPKVLFVTHSIPVAMDDASGPGDPAGTYLAQHLRVASRVAQAASARLGRPIDWEMAFCSRSGPPQVPWLEPDVNDRLRQLPNEGVRSVVVSPIGFVNDHMEVVYDLDTQAAQTASEVGLEFRRAATAGVHPAFVAALADELVLRARVSTGDAGENGIGRYRCPENCCRSGRPGPARPAACSA